MQDPRYVQNLETLLEKLKEKEDKLQAFEGRRIVGGIAVPEPDFPDCVAVRDDAKSGFCSGTLISQNAVLTAGHCLCRAKRFVPTEVLFGSSIRRKGKIFQVAKIVRHPKYNGRITTNDMMVLLLTDRVSSYVADPRPLADTKLIDAATNVRLVGFGATDQSGKTAGGLKRQTEVPVASTKCQGRVCSKTDKEYYGCFPRVEMVAGQPALQKDTCYGDSGGPLYVCNNRKKWFLAGVTSRSIKSIRRPCGDGTIYSRVDQFRKWIESIPGITLK